MLSTNPGPPIYIKSSKWKEYALRSKDIQWLGYLPFWTHWCCYCPRYSWVIDPRLLIHTVVLLAKQGHVCFVATSLRTSLHARNPRRGSFFSHEPGSTSGAVVCILFHICWSFLIYQSGWQLQVILSCCCPICGGLTLYSNIDDL